MFFENKSNFLSKYLMNFTSFSKKSLKSFCRVLLDLLFLIYIYIKLQFSKDLVGMETLLAE